MGKWLLNSLFFLSSQSFGEFRAYELKIDNTQTNKSRVVISSLDQIQYPVYFPLDPGETIVYVDSWLCKGNTSNMKSTCTKDEARNSI